MKDREEQRGATPTVANQIAWAKEAMDAITTDGVILAAKNGFATTGLHPWDPSKFTAEHFAAAEALGAAQRAAREKAGLPGVAEAAVEAVFAPVISPAEVDLRMEKKPRKTPPSGFINSHEYIARELEEEAREEEKATDAAAAAAAAKAAKKAEKDAKQAAIEAARAAKKAAKEAMEAAKAQKALDKAAAAAASAAASAAAAAAAASARSMHVDSAGAPASSAPVAGRKRPREMSATDAEVTELERLRALNKARRQQQAH